MRTLALIFCALQIIVTVYLISTGPGQVRAPELAIITLALATPICSILALLSALNVKWLNWLREN